MHEMSETVEIDKEWFNVSGHTGEILEGPFPSVETAVESAKRRSESFGENKMANGVLDLRTLFERPERFSILGDEEQEAEPGSIMERIQEKQRKMVTTGDDPEAEMPGIFQQFPSRTTGIPGEDEPAGSGLSEPIGMLISQLMEDFEGVGNKEKSKKIGPDLFGAGGIMGTGLTPTDALMHVLGAALTSNLPQEAALKMTLGIGNLPREFRQRKAKAASEMISSKVSAINALTQAGILEQKVTELEQKGLADQELIQARQDLREAIRTGDPEKIQEATRRFAVAAPKFSEAQRKVLVGEEGAVPGLPPGIKFTDLPQGTRQQFAKGLQDGKPISIGQAEEQARSAEVSIAETKALNKEKAALRALREGEITPSEAEARGMVRKGVLDDALAANSLVRELDRAIDDLQENFQTDDTLKEQMVDLVGRNNFLRTVNDIVKAEAGVEALPISEKQKAAMFRHFQLVRKIRSIIDDQRISDFERRLGMDLVGLKTFTTVADRIRVMTVLRNNTAEGLQFEIPQRFPTNVVVDDLIPELRPMPEFKGRAREEESEGRRKRAVEQGRDPRVLEFEER